MREVFRWQRPLANEKEERNSETQIQDPPLERELPATLTKGRPSRYPLLAFTIQC
jgi:hypothetical protein